MVMAMTMLSRPKMKFQMDKRLSTAKECQMVVSVDFLTLSSMASWSWQDGETCTQLVPHLMNISETEELRQSIRLVKGWGEWTIYQLS